MNGIASYPKANSMPPELTHLKVDSKMSKNILNLDHFNYSDDSASREQDKGHTSGRFYARR
jgi:hypothetical protein